MANIFTKLITIPAFDLDKFEKEEMMKRRQHANKILDVIG